MRDVKKRYLAGGAWRAKITAKKGKASRTTSKPGRLYMAYPPVEGWKGGLPEHNGWKPSGGK